ncbi:MAG: hypothetical protein K8T89_18355 [Planctomycetes bacterium]|nr:hypothetical protein [Planctomycetota bacterium]
MDMILDEKTEVLAILLRAEHELIDSYTAALTSLHGRSTTSLLRAICDEHCQAAENLRVFMEEIRPLGFVEEALSFSRLEPLFADSFNSFGVLDALKDRERELVEDYLQASRDDTLGAECTEVIACHLLPQARTHLAEIERLAAHTRHLATVYA